MANWGWGGVWSCLQENGETRGEGANPAQRANETEASTVGSKGLQEPERVLGHLYSIVFPWIRSIGIAVNVDSRERVLEFGLEGTLTVAY